MSEDGARVVGVYTTVGSRDDAQRLASALVERHLAACAQLSEIESTYVWKGAVQNDREFRVLFKTTPARCDAAIAAIRELHTYELPAIWTVAFERVDAAYAAWVAESVVER